ncbi:uncharacterized protein [Lolium perenne]|uniref:uncharacterized protein n=1 Tax=Lolium perenne TaxID=4522 RepID=UPI003A99A219
MPGFQDAVAKAWHSIEQADPFQCLFLKLQATARKLTSWSALSVGNIRHKLAISRELLLRFDKAQEGRLLTTHEDWLRKEIKRAYLGLASLERTMARQRARIASLKDGDANASFFHRQCSYRRQKNRIKSLTDDGRVLTEHADIAQAAFHHYDALLGTEVPRDRTLNFEYLMGQDHDLHDLDAPFSDDEIWQAVRRLPARKAPGPDGFTAEFLRA